MKKYSILFFLVAISSVVDAQIPSYVPISNLIAWYPFSGNTIDSSGHGHDGTNNGAVLTTDRFGNTNSAYLFDGMTSNISTSLLPPTGNAARTITCWFQYNSLPASCNTDLVIAGYGASSAGCFQVAMNFSLEIDYTGSPPKARVDGVCVATGATQIADTLTNGWHFFAALYDTSFGPDYDSIKIYVDGAFKTTSTVVFSSPITVNTGNLSNFLIGKGHYACPRYFAGKIDDVGIWDRALSSCELHSLYLGGRVSSITANPINDTVLPGGIGAFSIASTGGGVGQWQLNRGFGFMNLSNAAPYYGVNTQNLFVDPVTKAMNGYRYRCIQNNGGCFDTSSAASLKIITTDINTIGKKEEVHIFPNPAKNLINIEAAFLINKIDIVSLVGQRLFSEKYNSSQVVVDVNSFPEGIYIVRVNDLYIYRVVKQ